MVSESYAQSRSVTPLTLPYSTVRGHYAINKYKWAKRTNAYGKTYRVRVLRKTKHRRTPPAVGSAFIEVMAGSGFNPFLYQAVTGGAQAGFQVYNKRGGVAVTAAAFYDHKLPAQAYTKSFYKIPLRTRAQISGFMRWAHFNPTKRSGGMLILDALLQAQTDAHAEAGLSYYLFLGAKQGNARYGGWNTNAHQVGLDRVAQRSNLPSTMLFSSAIGFEVRGAQGLFRQGLQPYSEIVLKGYSAMVHHVQYVPNDGWGFLEDIFGQRWLRHQVTLGYSHIPRQITFPDAAISGWSTQHTLDLAWIDASASLSFGPYYQPMELTVGSTLRFMNNVRTSEVDGTLTRTELNIPEEYIQVYARFRWLRNLIQ